MLKREKKENACSPARKKKGQSTLEYIILVAAVVAALLVFLTPNGIFRTALNTTLVSGTNMMTNVASRLQGSYGDRP